jgi:hypothetical protein
LKPKRKRRRPFVHFVAEDLAGEGHAAESLFLGRFDEAALRRELEAGGILAGLAKRGYEAVDVHFDVEEGVSRLLVKPARGRESLIDLRLAEAQLTGPGLEGPLFVVAIHWLSMQDPRAVFTKERPRLPGQKHPGLGLAGALVLKVHAMAAAFGKDALVNFPEYYHNAVFYSRLYRFFSPLAEGRFQALQRDLAKLHVAEASWAIDRGKVVDTRTSRRVTWQPSEMIAPLTDRVRDYVEGAAYKRAVAEARETGRFAVRR